MKTCSTCKQDKLDTQFYSKGKENRTSSMCKSCFNAYCADRWTHRKMSVVEQFGGVCHDCKQAYHYSVFDFHHLDTSTKEMHWTKMRLVSDERMQKELAKCVMLCSNCHRLRHYGQLSG